MFTPLMFPHEYQLIERYLDKTDTLLEWGSGNGTIYFSGLVKNVITIEHDLRWVTNMKKVISAYNIDNIDIHHVGAHSPDPIPCRYEQFKDYVEYPKQQKFKFTKVLIDGRARKYCAKSIYEYIDENVLVFIHDFNRPDYQKTLKYYDVVEQLKAGQGIGVLKKKPKPILDDNYY